MSNWDKLVGSDIRGLLARHNSRSLFKFPISDGIVVSWLSFKYNTFKLVRRQMFEGNILNSLKDRAKF